MASYIVFESELEYDYLAVVSSPLNMNPSSSWMPPASHDTKETSRSSSIYPRWAKVKKLVATEQGIGYRPVIGLDH